MSYTLFAIELALYYTLGWVGGHWPWDWEPEKKNVGEYYRSIPPHVTTGESLIVDSWRSCRHLRTPLHIYTLHSHNFFRLKQVNKISYTESEDHLNLSLIIQLLTQLGIVYSHPTSFDFSIFHPSYWQCRLLSNCCYTGAWRRLLWQNQNTYGRRRTGSELPDTMILTETRETLGNNLQVSIIWCCYYLCSHGAQLLGFWPVCLIIIHA